MISIRGLTKAFGGTVAVDALTLDVPPGQILGLLGPNGAGKTTTLKMLTGMLAPDAGQALICGVDIRRSRSKPSACSASCPTPAPSTKR
jgi:ABC-2 type transport system ATP-binding protein